MWIVKFYDDLMAENKQSIKNKRTWNVRFYDNPTSENKKVSISNTRPRNYEINRKKKRICSVGYYKDQTAEIKYANLIKYKA